MKIFNKTLAALLICGSLGLGLTADKVEASELELTPNLPETQELKKHPYDPPPPPPGPGPRPHDDWYGPPPQHPKPGHDRWHHHYPPPPPPHHGPRW